MKKLRKALASTLSILIALSSTTVTAFAQSPESPPPSESTSISQVAAAIQEGVTVNKDEESPTGYSATFGYRNDEAQKVQVCGDFKMYLPKDDGSYQEYSPYEWQPGMYPIEGASYKLDMEKDADTGLWTLTVPLPNDIYRYYYLVDDVQIQDPANLPLTNTNENGGTDPQSVFYVPFDPEKQVVDNSIVMPRTDGKTGTVSFDSYADLNGDTRPLGIYLPYNYDANREEPYKVLYMCHGMGGNEIEWVFLESTPNILDNLIADGKLEDTILVSMNNTVYNMDFDVISENLINHIIPHMEDTYNVSTNAKDRALAGVSMGGRTASAVYFRNPTAFGYIGLFSGAAPDEDLTKYENLDSATIFLGAGQYDFGREAFDWFSVKPLMDKFDKLGVDYTFGLTPHAHDFFNNTRLFTMFTEEVLWKDEPGSEIKEGPTVQKDENSPTGYSVTFAYRNPLAQTVQISGDFNMYLPKEEGGYDLYTPYEWQPGMYSIQGANYVEDMVKTTASGLWTITVPLPGDIYRYYFIVDGKQIQDPANLPLTNTNENGGTDPQSVVHVPFDSDKQIVDNSIIMPRTDGKTGTVSFDSYADIKGDTRPLGIYLPYNYDANREEPYKVLYMCHGGGGNEIEWVFLESSPNVLDNLIAAGELEDTILVSMNNTVYGGDYDVIADNLLKNIIPHMENSYNVSTNPKDRALAGVSMGSMTTSSVYYRYPTEFGYIGLFSGANSGVDLTEYENLDFAHIFIGAGKYDFAYEGNPNFSAKVMGEKLEAIGVDYTFYFTPHSHDFFNNTRLFTAFVQDFLWKEEPGTGIKEGATVNKDENSPTGYSVTFAYRNSVAQTVQIEGDFYMYLPNDEGGYDQYSPYEWQPGMESIGWNRYKTNMVKSTASGLWTITIPLPSDIYRYYFIVDGKQIQDPANPPLTNPNENGGTDPQSVVYVPFDAEKQTPADDNSIIMPRTDGKTGAVSFASYTDIKGDTRPLGVYLPYNYDANREEPYKVLYMCHGGGGNEIEWVSLESAPNILDNLIAEGKLEDTILVSMNNTVYGGDYDLIADNLVKNIIPYMEANYNVSSESYDRAIAGVSMGSLTTSSIYYRYPTMFRYVGLFSGGNPDDLSNYENLDYATIMTGCGRYDIAYENGGMGMVDLMKRMDEHGLKYTFYMTPHAHDMFNNTRLFTYFVKNILWRDGGEYTVRAGDTVKVPVMIKGAEDAAALEAYINYDSSLLTLTEVTAADGFIVSYSIQNGQMKLVAMADDGLGQNGDVVFAYLTFTATKDITGVAETKVTADSTAYTGNTSGYPEALSYGMSPVFISIVSGLKGDVNGDGVVNVADALMTLQYTSGNREFDKNQLYIADMNDDGVVNTADVMLIMNATL